MSKANVDLVLMPFEGFVVDLSEAVEEMKGLRIGGNLSPYSRDQWSLSAIDEGKDSDTEGRD